MFRKIRTRRRRILEMRFHLSSVAAPESPTVSPPGPLVRFDWSPSLFFLGPGRGRDSGDRCRRTAAPRGLQMVGMEPQGRGGPSGGRFALWGGRGCRR